MSSIPIIGILVEDRIRKDLGDIDAMCNSIKEFGIIQPIVLSYEQTPGSSNINDAWPKLVAGGRRLAAVKRLGWKELLHGRDFVWRNELTDDGTEKRRLRLKAVELEENLKRQELSWQEQVKAKADLLSLMQSIYGAPQSGGLTRQQRMGLAPTGFGVNKLAAMLGESNAQTSKDLELASVIKAMPHLAKAETKESARRQLSILGAVASMTAGAKSRSTAQALTELTATGEIAAKKVPDWILYEGDFSANAKMVPDGMADLVYTDLPFGVSLSQMSSHNAGAVSYGDDRKSVVEQLGELCRESFRMLHDDRFAIFFFGFNYYGELLQGLQGVGFGVNPVPVVWYKHTRTTENPNTRYANAYDCALVAMKGSPVFIRPGQTNVVDIPAVAAGQKLQIAQQPVELCERFILDCTSSGSLIVDFCAGSGTTGVASLKTKRSVILFERETQACALIKARLGGM